MSMQITHERETSVESSDKWTNRGLMFGNNVASKYMPGLGTHNGQLVCMFVDEAASELRYAFGSNTSWGILKTFNSGGVTSRNTPALAEYGGVLHTVFEEAVDDQHDLVHYQYDGKAGTWGKRVGLAQHSSKEPTLAVYNNKLFCAYVADNSSNDLMYTVWTESTGWSVQRPANGEKSQGAPALFLIGNELHLLFAAHNDERDVIELVYNAQSDGWSRTAVQPYERAEYGVSAASPDSHSTAFMGFLSAASNGHVLVSKFSGGAWLHNEEVGETSYNTPALAILTDTVSCAYTAHDSSHELLWTQRSVQV